MKNILYFILTSFIVDFRIPAEMDREKELPTTLVRKVCSDLRFILIYGNNVLAGNQRET